MYTKNKCAVRIGNKQTDFFSQERGVKQGCNLSPTLFNIYINELAKTLERSSAPGITLHDTEIKCLLYADDLVLMSPTKEGLQQHLDHLYRFCQTWALTVNLNKTNIMIFQKRSRSQDVRPKFSIDTKHVEYCTHYTYLGLKLSSTGHFNDVRSS